MGIILSIEGYNSCTTNTEVVLKTNFSSRYLPKSRQTSQLCVCVCVCVCVERERGGDRERKCITVIELTLNNIYFGKFTYSG